jgi:beta-glucosidase
MTVDYIEGMQEQGTMATIKHFALNNSEFDRHGLSSNADERTINEIYFPTFRKAVEKAHVGAVMTSYNMINGVHAAENSWLIRENLRSWGFEGIVMSDWTSTYTTLGCLESGLDLEMPKAYLLREEFIRPLLDNGVVTEELLDEKVQHILQALIAFDLLKAPAAPKEENSDFSRFSAYQLALESPVLLKNDGLLPLKKKTRIAVLGADAFNLPRGGGSGNVHPAIEERISIAKGLQGLGKNYPVDLLYPIGDRYDTPENIAKAEKAGAVVVVVGYDLKTEGENFDRTYQLPAKQEEEIQFALDHNKKVIVVVFSGGEYDLGKWGDKASAILSVWYAGQAGGRAVADLLTGKASPSGHLPFTFWGSWEKNPVHDSYHPSKNTKEGHKAAGRNTRAAHDKYSYTEYTEGVFLGYRGADHFGVKPLYPFGYGLSYTRFEYGQPKILKQDKQKVYVSVPVKNAGSRDGDEVVQLYASYPTSTVEHPKRQLKGFERVTIPAGQTLDVILTVDKSDLTYWDSARHAFVPEAGPVTFEIGASSADIRQTLQVQP